MSCRSAANDMVISYLVGPNGTTEETYKPLQEALASGYRVIDVLPTPMGSGITVVVTVVLTHDQYATVYLGGRQPPPRK
jgi:hypothetical protein